MQEKEINVYFFDWLSEYNKSHNILNSCSINPLTKRTSTWKTIENTIIESEYPPIGGIKVHILKDLEIEAIPYKTIINEDPIKCAEKKDISKLHQQINYSNTMLNTMSKQLTRIESQNDQDTQNTSASTSKPLKQEPVKPIYKLTNISQKDLDTIKFGDERIEDIRKKLEKLSLGKSSANTLELNRMGR